MSQALGACSWPTALGTLPPRAPAPVRRRVADRVAHEAGFADAAHFSRVFRGMLGVTPSHVLRHSNIAVASRPGPSQGGAPGPR